MCVFGCGRRSNFRKSLYLASVSSVPICQNRDHHLLFKVVLNLLKKMLYKRYNLLVLCFQLCALNGLKLSISGEASLRVSVVLE